MAHMEEEHAHPPEAGPSSPSRSSSTYSEPVPNANRPDSTEPEPSLSRNTHRSPTPQSQPSTSPSHSRIASRSPVAARRGSKRSSTFSPVPEEPVHIDNRDLPSPPSKRPRPPADPDTKRRGQRLFGVLNSTLTQFQRESQTDRAASVAAKRAQIEARLASKAKEEDKVIDALQRRRALVWEARTLAEEIAQGDAQAKTLRALKRRMASFLYTPSVQPRTTRGARLAEDIPTSNSPMSKVDDREGNYALYFLPGKTLPEQEDRLNEQEDDVDERIDRFDDDWVAERSRLMEQLDKVKAKIREV